MKASLSVRVALFLVFVILFGTLVIKHRSEPPSASQQEQPASQQQVTVSQEGPDEGTSKRDALAAKMTNLFRKHGVNASASAVNNELVISVEDMKLRSERDDFAGTYFPEKIQQGLCDIGIKKLLVSGEGVFSDKNEYTLACKLTTEDVSRRNKALDESRHSFAEQMYKDIQASPVIAGIEAHGTELVLIGKNGIDTRTVSSSFVKGTGPSFISSVCGMGFTAARVQQSDTDRGTLIPFHCTENK